jgi:hypothetical protein
VAVVATATARRKTADDEGMDKKQQVKMKKKKIG